MQRRILQATSKGVNKGEAGENSAEKCASCQVCNFERWKPCTRCRLKDMAQIYGSRRNQSSFNLALDGQSIERLGRRSPGSNVVNDLREELIHTKRLYSMALVENSRIRTKLKAVEKERKNREEQIERLLDSKNENLAQLDASKYEDRIQLNTMHKKLIHYERILRQKTEQNSELMSNRRVVKIAEFRARQLQLENECAQLRDAIARSVPEVEHIREKHEYIKVIERLTEENIQMRKVLVEGHEKRCRNEAKNALEHVYRDADLVKKLRNSAITMRKKADSYKSTLKSLVHGNRALHFKNRSNSESGVMHQIARQKMNSETGSLTDEITKRTNFLPAIMDSDRFMVSNKPLAVVISTKRATVGSSLVLPKLGLRNLGRMSTSLDQRDLERILPRMYNSISTSEDEANNPNKNRDSDSNRDKDDNGQGEGQNHGEDLFRFSSQNLDLDQDDPNTTIDARNSGYESVDEERNSCGILASRLKGPEPVVYGDGTTLELCNTREDSFILANGDTADWNVDREMDNIICALHSHILRLKMLKIREQNRDN